ncbi:HEAT repeat domain-containing protein [Echinicola shivajiensis]|uniref:HEAT repeat domain-containing protein n=1 Tax=Echinicola shivajiensis TaxID=1035916 RepID=UPI001BFC313D|nr:HEAT repeat domain-containing protein [Echinicola shivajiensis]
MKVRYESKKSFDEVIVSSVDEGEMHGAFQTEDENLNNQSTLASVALHDPDAEVRKIAVGKLKTQSTLSSVVLHDPDAEVRKLAVERLE